MTQELTDASDCETRLNDILLRYLEACHLGQAPERALLLAENPDLRAELEEFFACHDEVERVAVPFRSVSDRSPIPQALANECTADIGQLGDFRILREVGRGGMGVVYEAEQVSLRRRVALKVLPFAAALDPRQLQRFKNEALAAAHLRHENIVPVYAFGEERGIHYYTMQFIEGRSLAALISELKVPATQDYATSVAATRPSFEDGYTDGPAFTTERSLGTRSHYSWIAKMGRQAALALDYAHSVGVVHRDVKPANLLLDPLGKLWVTDFGLAQIAGDTGLTLTGELLGTLRYASPEQVVGRRGVVDNRSDVYSLGATLYELLTLRPLFEGRNRPELLRQIADDEPRMPRSIQASIPPELEMIVLKALGKEQSERYRSARELADDLQRFLEDRPILARRPTPVERFKKLLRRHPAFVNASVVVLILLSVGSLLSTILIRAEQAKTKIEMSNAEMAYQREKLRAEEAEARFLLARRSVDELLRISQEELADRPGLELVRKRLLWSVLAYYQEFLQQRQENPGARAELLDAKQRVEKILADLVTVRASRQLYLLSQPAVLDDLNPGDQQRSKVSDFCDRVGSEWRASFNDMGKLAPAELGRRAIERARDYEAELNLLLTPAQYARLRQIALQAEGLGAFGEPEVIAELKLTSQQRAQLRAIESEAFSAWMRDNRLSNDRKDGTESAQSREKVKNDRIASVLTTEQLKRWRAMTGEPVKFPIVPFSPMGIGPRNPMSGNSPRPAR
jgi:serine/threonine protein kinase